MSKIPHYRDEYFMNIKYDMWIEKSGSETKVGSITWYELTDVHASLEFIGYNTRYGDNFLRMYKSVVDSKDEKQLKAMNYPGGVSETDCGIRYINDNVPMRAFDNMVRKALKGRLDLNVSASCGDLIHERTDICEWPDKTEDHQVILERTDWSLLECLTNVKNGIIFYAHRED